MHNFPALYMETLYMETVQEDDSDRDSQLQVAAQIRIYVYDEAGGITVGD